VDFERDKIHVARLLPTAQIWGWRNLSMREKKNWSVDRGSCVRDSMCGTLGAKRKEMWDEGAGPRRSVTRVPSAIGRSGLRARRNETCSRKKKRKRGLFDCWCVV